MSTSQPGTGSSLSVKAFKRTGAAPHVLVLTSTLGSGHLRAAQAVEAALLEHSPTSTVQTIDFWSLMDAGVAQTVRQAYLRLVQESPELYDRIFQFDRRTWRDILESDGTPSPALAEGLELLTTTGADAARLEPSGGRYALDRVLFRLLCAALPERARRRSGNGVVKRRALIKWGWARLARRLLATRLPHRLHQLPSGATEAGTERACRARLSGDASANRAVVSLQLAGDHREMRGAGPVGIRIRGTFAPVCGPRRSSGPNAARYAAGVIAPRRLNSRVKCGWSA